MYPLSVVLFTISLFMVELYFLPASESYICVLPMYIDTDKLYSLRLIKYKNTCQTTEISTTPPPPPPDASSPTG